jgi:hypothetical protein
MFRQTAFRPLALGALTLVATLTVVACSGSDQAAKVPTLDKSDTSVAPAKTSAEDEVYLTRMQGFVDCIRKSGFPEMSDPTALGGIVRADLLKLQGPKGRAILKKCYPPIDGLPVPPGIQKQRIEEQALDLTDEQKAANIEFSKCMQENGVPEYPDPEANGLQAVEPWSLPNSTVPKPPGLQGALDVCHKILDPTDPQP